jgi:hypothetical protein
MADSAGAAVAIPTANFRKQAIVVIHGMGEQMPMDTIKNFVDAAWRNDTSIHTREKLPNVAEMWSKPDIRTGSLELRRITTRQSKDTPSFPKGVRSDFYELYWADLSAGSTWSEVKDWIFGLLLRNPLTRVPRDVFLAWLLLWVAALIVIFLSIVTVLPADASIGPIKFWEYPPLRWFAGLQSWQSALIAAGLAWGMHQLLLPTFGRVVRYTRAKPENIAARKDIRQRGLDLLAELHKGEYERIILVGHSLGSIVAYDLITYFWAARPQSHTIERNNPDELPALVALETALNNSPAGVAGPNSEFLARQGALCKLLRHRPKPKDGAPDSRWLITDLITLGSPLAHAEFLLANSRTDLDERVKQREFPICPPLREKLDPLVQTRAQEAGLPFDAQDPRLLCFPLDEQNPKTGWQLHHAAPFAVVRWTNIFDPASFIFCGDIISGPLAPVFGPGIIDIDIAKGRSRCSFTHTKYWTGADPTPLRITELRKALNLAGQDREV